MPTLDASTPSAVYDDTQGTTSLTTAAFTPPAGSIVVAKVGNSAATMANNVPTGLTFTSRVDVGDSAQQIPRLTIFTATGAGASVTVTASFNVGSGVGQTRWLNVEVWTAAQLAATPAVNGTLRTTFPTAPSATITTAAAGSVVTWGCIDNDGTNTAGTYLSSATQAAFHYSALPTETLYYAYQQAAAAGSQTYGMSAPTQNWILGALEIQASGAVTATPFRRIGKRRW